MILDLTPIVIGTIQNEIKAFLANPNTTLLTSTSLSEKSKLPEFALFTMKH